MSNTPDQNNDLAKERAIFLKHLPRDVIQSMIESRAKAKDESWLDAMEQAGVFSIHNMVEDQPMMDGTSRKAITGHSPPVAGAFPLMAALSKCLLSSEIIFHTEDPFTGRDITFNGVKPIGCKQLNVSQKFKETFGRIVAGYLFESEWKDENVELLSLANQLSKVNHQQAMEDRLTGTAAVLAVIASAIGDTKSLKGLLDRFENINKVVIPYTMMGSQVNDSTFNPMLSAYEYNRTDSLRVFLEAGCKIDDMCKHIRGGKSVVYQDILTNLVDDMKGYGAMTFPSFLVETFNALKETDSFTARVEESGKILMSKKPVQVYMDFLYEIDYFKQSPNYLAEIAFESNNLVAIKKLREHYDWSRIQVDSERQAAKAVRENPIYNFYRRWTEQGSPDQLIENEFNNEVSLWLKDCVKAGKGALLTHQDTQSFPYILSEVKNYAGIVVCLEAGHDTSKSSGNILSLDEVAVDDQDLEKIIRSYKGKKAAYGILDEIFAEMDSSKTPHP